MVNWFKGSTDILDHLNTEYKYDLPVPENGHECIDFLNVTENLIALFDEDSVHMDYEGCILSGLDLLEELNPLTVRKFADQKRWENDMKMWLFRNHVTKTLKSAFFKYKTPNERGRLYQICLEYKEKLIKHYEELTGRTIDGTEIEN